MRTIQRMTDTSPKRQRGKNKPSLALRAGMFVTLALVGCTPLPLWPKHSEQQAHKPPSPSVPAEVKVGGDGLQLGESQVPGIARDEFLGHAQELLQGGQPERVRRYVSRYPDAALEALRSARPGPGRVLEAVAQVYDETCCREAAWLMVMQERAEKPGRFAAYDEARKQTLEHARAGRNREAARVNLLAALGREAPYVLFLDAAQVTAEAMLRAGEPAEAVKVLHGVLDRHAENSPHQAAQLGLLLSEAYRRGGKEAEAVAAWESAVTLAAPFLAGPGGADPALWERVAYLRPVGHDWPAAVRQLRQEGNVHPAAVRTPSAQADEVLLWRAIGSARLARREAQAALLAFKRAETCCADRATAASLQLDEAKALIALDQTPAALALLAPLAGKPDSPARRPAYALLGALKFRAGQVQQAVTMLKRAVEPDGKGDWPGLADAEADLGLAYLAGGEEEKGLRWLHSARARFEKAGDQASVAQTVENEAAYFEHTGKRDEATRLKEKKTATTDGTDRTDNKTE